MIGLFVLAVPARPAEAHAFSVRTDPPQGARLDRLPSSVRLEFSEAVRERGVRVTLRVGEGGTAAVLTTELEDGDRTVRAATPPDVEGIVIIDWEVVAEDGHATAGEFAFAVGSFSGSIPSSRFDGGSPDPVDIAADWLFLAGLALAAGALALSFVDGGDGARRNTVRVGLLASATAAVLALAVRAGDSGQREQLALAGAAGGAAIGMLASRLERTRWPTLVAIVGAAAAWTAQGHSAVSNGPVGWAIDLVHLLAGATWAGALSLVAAMLWRGRHATDHDAVLAVVRRYARLAAVFVVVLAAAGLIAAFLMLNDVDDLWATTYGKLVLVKSALFATAVVLAAASRFRGLRRSTWQTLRRLTPLEAVVLVVVLAVTAILTNTAPPPSAVAASDLLGPPPMTGPIMRSAGQAGILTVAVAAGDGQIQVEVLPPGGDARGATAHVEALLPDGSSLALEPRPCGQGCFAQRLVLPSGTTQLSVTASAPDWAGGTFRTDLDWPPAPADPQLVADLVTTMRAIPSLEVTEQVTSGPDSAGAPGTIELSGAAFVATEPYAAGSADDVYPLRGEDGFRLYISGDRIWVTVWLDDEGRLAREQVVDVGHVVERTFRYP